MILYILGELLSVSDERGSAVLQQKVGIMCLQSELLTARTVVKATNHKMVGIGSVGSQSQED